MASENSSRRLNIALLTVSDSRGPAEDGSGDFLAAAIEEAGHTLSQREIVKDEIDAIRQVVLRWCRDPSVQVVISTGGTGFAARDVTPEAVTPLLDKEMPGFGEIFRWVSYQEIGSSSLQSRAFAGVCSQTWVFCLPGSTSACRTAWQQLLSKQLDSETRPCNLVQVQERL